MIMEFFCTGRPISHVSTGGGSSNCSSVSDERGQPPADDSFEVDPDDAVLKQTTAVVKTVMELSNKVPISRPSEYVDLVRVRERERTNMIVVWNCPCMRTARTI